MKSETAVQQLNRIRKLVDKYPEGPRLAAEGWSKNWQTLVAIILSAQTRDTKTIEVCNKLFKKYKTPEQLGSASLKSIEKEIGSINYYKTKAKNIRETCKMISKEGIGETIEDLMRFPGVGRKVANVYLVEVIGAAAIGVDTHVGRISFKLGWTKSKNPHIIEKDLERLFPKKYWNSINYILVSFGQIYGRSRTRENEILESLINRA
jgi:endonuclease III